MSTLTKTGDSADEQRARHLGRDMVADLQRLRALLAGAAGIVGEKPEIEDEPLAILLEEASEIAEFLVYPSADGDHSLRSNRARA